MTDSPNDAARRRLLRAGLGAAALAALPATRALAVTPMVPDTPAQIEFLAPEAATAAIARASDDRYFDRMDLLDIRARMKSPLTGKSLAQARAAARDFEAAAVLPFSGEERLAIRGVIERMQPLLRQRAPLYARTPWSLIKLDDRAEGGMPHTRGPHVVLPKSLVDNYVRVQREASASGQLATTPRGRSLLLHEQTHVLERANPALFANLITEVLGFARMAPAPSTAWLAQHNGINPDGPDLEWAFPLDRIGGSGWVMPAILFPDLPVPRIPEDFQTVGIEVARTAEGWRIVEDDGVPRRRDLDKIVGYDAYFPFPDEDFHPNEIIAVALAHWILRDVPDLDRRPLMPGIAAWAKTALA